MAEIRYVYKVVNGVGLTPKLEGKGGLLRRLINSGGTFEARDDFFKNNPKIIEGVDVEYVCTRGGAIINWDREENVNKVKTKIVKKKELVNVVKKDKIGLPITSAEVLKDSVKEVEDVEKKDVKEKTPVKVKLKKATSGTRRKRVAKNREKVITLKDNIEINK